MVSVDKAVEVSRGRIKQRGGNIFVLTSQMVCAVHLSACGLVPQCIDIRHG